MKRIKHLYHKHQEKINYLLVGAYNTIFGYFVFLLLYYLFGARVHYLIIFLFSNVAAITNAYIVYKGFVFKTKGNYLREYLMFYVVYGGVMALNFILLPVLVELFQIIPPVAQGLLVSLSVIFSYVGHKHYSFGGSPRVGK